MGLRRAVGLFVLLGSSLTASAGGSFPFTEERWIKDGNSKKSLQVVDLDQDKDQDVLVVETRRTGMNYTTLKWFQNKKKGTKWVERVIDGSLREAVDTAVGDVDGDGDLDVVVTAVGRDKNRKGGARWYENVGKAKAWEHHAIDTAGATGTVRLGDIDGDGDLDVVVGTYRELIAYRNEGKGKTWSAKRTIAKVRVRNRALVLMDYDGDKDLDAVARAGDTFSWYENAKGAWKPHLITNTSKHLPTSLQAIDFDKDGDTDLVVGARRRAAVYINYGKGKFGPEEIVETGNFIVSFQALAADVNRDGKLDVVLNYPRKLVWYEVDDDDDWTAHEVAQVPEFAQYFAVGDLDGDGDPDLVRNRGTRFAILWWENTAPKKSTK